MYPLRNIGCTNVLGIDPYLERDIQYSNGLSVLRKSIFEIEDGNWDLIMFHHSLEHVQNPREVLQRSASLLRHGGLLLIRTPIIPSFAWEKYGTRWVQIDAPRHMFVPSVRALERLGTKVGLQLDSESYDSTEFQFWGSEQYMLGIPLLSENSYSVNKADSPFTRKQIRIWAKEAEKLNRELLGDQARMWFRKS